MKRVHLRQLTVALGLLALGGLLPISAHAEEKTLRLSHTLGLYMAPLFVAVEKGWLDQALAEVGYTLERRVVESGPVTTEAMAANKVDVGQVGLSVIVTTIGRGLPAKIILNSGIAGEGVIVRADSDFKSLADLKGKTIAIPGKGTMPDFVVRIGLEKAGLDPAKDVRFVEVAPPDQKQALFGSLVDAMVAWEPLASDAIRSGGRMLAYGQDIYPDHQHDTIAATDLALKNHPDALQAFAKTFLRAQSWMKDNPVEAKEIAVKYTGMAAPTIDAAWGNILREPNGIPSLESTQAFADFLSKWGYVKTKIDAKSIIDARFVREHQ